VPSPKVRVLVATEGGGRPARRAAAGALNASDGHGARRLAAAGAYLRRWKFRRAAVRAARLRPPSCPKILPEAPTPPACQYERAPGVRKQSRHAPPCHDAISLGRSLRRSLRAGAVDLAPRAPRHGSLRVGPACRSVRPAASAGMMWRAAFVPRWSLLRGGRRVDARAAACDRPGHLSSVVLRGRGKMHISAARHNVLCPAC
jgi:hypothetical protein